MQTHRKTLNNDQLTVLGLLYKFRFGSSDLIAEYFEKPKGVYMYKRLNILVDRGLVGKRHEASYRLKGWPVAYYLTPDGYRVIQELYKEDSKVPLAYKSLRVSDEHMAHCLALFKLYNTFKKQYGDNLKFFAKNDMGELDYLPAVKPDAYLELNGVPFFLDFCSSGQVAAIRNKLRAYANWIDENEYDADFVTPVLLVVGANEAIAKKASNVYQKSNLGRMTSVIFAHTSLSKLRGEYQAWQTIDEPEHVRSLVQLS
ncbi:MAG TPA: replication-relaxation family protein [Candidatus Saccharimonadales bacterium]|nr:replication-relaxation family protein [Candidatus Saccharimonadales bacterium]